MNSYIIGQLVETGLLVTLGLCFVVIIATSFHDIWITHRLRTSRQQRRKFQRNRPHVTVLVYAHNSASVISDCLASITKNRYRQYDIVVVNNKSTDNTRRQLLQFQKDHPAAGLVVYGKRKHSSLTMALRQAYKKSQHGEIIITIRAEARVPNTFLRDSVMHFLTLNSAARIPHATVLLFNEYIPASLSFVVLRQYFLQVSRQLIKKLSSHLSTRKVIIGDSLLHNNDTAMYSSAALQNSRVSTKYHYVYDSRLSLAVRPTIIAQSPMKRSARVTAWAALFRGSVVVIFSYSVYMAATLQNTSLLLFGWLIVVVWFIAAIWSGDAYRTSDKLQLSVTIPSLYFLLYLTVVAELATQIIRLFFHIVRILIRRVVTLYTSQPEPLQDW